MPRLNRQNIDRKTNKPNPKQTEGVSNDSILNRAEQTRRDDDVIRTPKRTHMILIMQLNGLLKMKYNHN
jgi:hypothetical protein